MGNKKNVLSIKKGILQVLDKNPNQTFNYKQIAKRLCINDPSGRNHIKKNLKKLATQNIINNPTKGIFQAKKREKYHRGTLDISNNGTGYIISDDFEEDIKVSSTHHHKAFGGDEVLFYTYTSKGKRKREGKIIEITARKRTRFVGTLQKRNGTMFVRVSPRTATVDFYIASEPQKPTTDGARVLIAFTNWEKTKSPQAKIIEVLGKPGEAETEIHTILAEYGLPYTFDTQIKQEANRINEKISANEIIKRLDFRDVLTFTIDPADAKDFDDALSFQEKENGDFEVGIHIADVSHYIKPGSPLDNEAYRRATSVYLVDRVVPMLPEQLSNKVCSLRPNEEKLTFSAIFTLDTKGNVKEQKFARTVINSNYRFAYQEAQYIIDTREATIPATLSLTAKTYTVDEKAKEAILQLNTIANHLREKRTQSGAISFDKEEVCFLLDKEKTPKEVYIKTSKEANKLIEEYMLLANKKVSEFIAKKDNKKTFVFRVHDEPDEEKLDQLKSVINGFGYSLNLASAKTTAHSINKLLKDITNTPEQNLIDTLTIRSMSKAKYTTQNIGHYGLAFDYYTHFTSPIRRYPDVVAHRLLQHYLDGKSSPNAQHYEPVMNHCSTMEVLATKAERDSVKFMQVKYMQAHIGETFTGIVSGVVERGLYVELEGNKCEGMARPQDIPGDFYVFDERNFAFVGQKNKKLIQLGDRVTIKVTGADPIKRHLDFNILAM